MERSRQSGCVNWMPCAEEKKGLSEVFVAEVVSRVLLKKYVKLPPPRPTCLLIETLLRKSVVETVPPEPAPPKMLVTGRTLLLISGV
ncbi:MAG: hypothetical protein LC795_22650 [Acidobacteria bacterium]|nr:hypothetical protein [Acidobacteriota bacterium]